MTRGRPKELTEIERGLLRAGLVASLRSREDRFWAYDAQRIFQDIMKRDISWGTLLPALRRLQAMGYLTSEWDTPDPAKRPIRYYTLTEPGKFQASTSTASHAPLGMAQLQKETI